MRWQRQRWQTNFNIPERRSENRAQCLYNANRRRSSSFPSDAIRGGSTQRRQGRSCAADVALSRILAGTGFTTRARYPAARSASCRTAQRAGNRCARIIALQPHAAARIGGHRNRGRHVVEDQGRYPDRSDCDHGAVAGAIDVAPDRGRSRSRERSAEPDVLENEFQRLQHPDSRHRHAGDFGDDRSGGGRRVQRHSLHPQSFLRTGILRRQPGRSAARSARHALWPQCDGGRGECRFRQTDRSI